MRLYTLAYEYKMNGFDDDVVDSRMPRLDPDDYGDVGGSLDDSSSAGAYSSWSSSSAAANKSSTSGVADPPAYPLVIAPGSGSSEAGDFPPLSPLVDDDVVFQIPAVIDAQDGSAAFPPGEWSCGACTFRNVEGLTSCDICMTPR
jgi:hypothetical protein